MNRIHFVAIVSRLRLIGHGCNLQHTHTHPEQSTRVNFLQKLWGVAMPESNRISCSEAISWPFIVELHSRDTFGMPPQYQKRIDRFSRWNRFPPSLPQNGMAKNESSVNKQDPHARGSVSTPLLKLWHRTIRESTISGELIGRSNEHKTEYADRILQIAEK